MAGTSAVDHRPIILTILLLGAAVLLQTTVLEFVAVFGVKPDLQLILVAFLALRRGSMSGQIAGFVGGLLEDVVTLSPLGFHAIVKALVGFCAGLPFGLIRASAVVVPVLLVAGAVVVKGLASGVLSLAFQIPLDAHLLEARFWIESAYNVILAPLLFALLSQVRLLRSTSPRPPS
ncbi:MAG: rod shape-determining protein MreD [Spirochaetaceae bacterium]|nr:rod shape-determining protein MreD [Spirochaetaceae bacterium]